MGSIDAAWRRKQEWCWHRHHQHHRNGGGGINFHRSTKKDLLDTIVLRIDFRIMFVNRTTKEGFDVQRILFLWEKKSDFLKMFLMSFLVLFSAGNFCQWNCIATSVSYKDLLYHIYLVKIVVYIVSIGLIVMTNPIVICQYTRWRTMAKITWMFTWWGLSRSYVIQ